MPRTLAAALPSTVKWFSGLMYRYFSDKPLWQRAEERNLIACAENYPRDHLRSFVHETLDWQMAKANGSSINRETISTNVPSNKEGVWLFEGQ